MSLSPVLVLWAAAALASHAAAEGNAVDQRVEEVIDEEAAHPIYEFVYEVGTPEKSSGRSFGHKESRDGARTWGTYFQQLSDGRLQTVRYWVDHSGYHAEVEYSGEPKADWDDGGAAKRSRLVSRGQQDTKVNTEQPLVQALLESFPKESLQTKRSSSGQPSSPRVEASPRQQEERSSADRHALRPIPVREYAALRATGRRSRGDRPNRARPSVGST